MPLTHSHHQQEDAGASRRSRLESFGLAAQPLPTGIAAAAFRTEDCVEVASLISDYLIAYGGAAEVILDASLLEPQREAGVHRPVNGWTVVTWPRQFYRYNFRLARTIAPYRALPISAIHLYEDQYWEHLCCLVDDELHAFCSRPDFWRDDSREDYLRMRAYHTDPSNLADALDVPMEPLLPYLIDADKLRDRAAKAHPDDQFALRDPRVAVDFWQRLGITYSTNVSNLAAVLRLKLNSARLAG